MLHVIKSSVSSEWQVAKRILKLAHFRTVLPSTIFQKIAADENFYWPTLIHVTISNV